MGYFSKLTPSQKVLMLLGILIIILAQTSDNPVDDKKAVSFKNSKLLATTGGLGLFFTQLVSKGGLLAGPVGWIIIGVSSLLFLAPGIITRWQDLFRPQPTIPSWVFIAGFMLLALFILKGQRRQ